MMALASSFRSLARLQVDDDLAEVGSAESVGGAAADRRDERLDVRIVPG